MGGEWRLAEWDALSHCPPPAADCPAPGGRRGTEPRRRNREVRVRLPAGRDGRRTNGMRGFHDIGGQPAGPVDRTEHEPALWEKRVHALQILLTDPSRN